MWYTDTNWEGTGSAFGFATEISPGAAPLTLDSMKKTVAKDALWDPETGPTEDWNYHCGAAGKPPARSLKSFGLANARGSAEDVSRWGVRDAAALHARHRRSVWQRHLRG